MIALAGPAIAAATPEDLGPEISQAAQRGDSNALLASMSASTRRILPEAESAQSRLIAAQQALYSAVDQRFGPGQPGRDIHTSVMGNAPGLTRFADVAVVGVEHDETGQVLVRLRTVAKQADGRAVAQEDVFPVVRENGQWKLNLTGLIRSRIRRLSQQASVYGAVAEGVRSGRYTDRVAAYVALLRGSRGIPGR
jgi:hypothetical protein